MLEVAFSLLLRPNIFASIMQEEFTVKAFQENNGGGGGKKKPLQKVRLSES